MIDKNIPIPAYDILGPHTGRGRPAKHPFVKMEIGDSTFYIGEGSGGKGMDAAKKIAKIKGWRFIGRVENDGIRIWRVA